MRSITNKTHFSLSFSDCFSIFPSFFIFFLILFLTLSLTPSPSSLLPLLTLSITETFSIIGIWSSFPSGNLLVGQRQPADLPHKVHRHRLQHSRRGARRTRDLAVPHGLRRGLRDRRRAPELTPVRAPFQSSSSSIVYYGMRFSLKEIVHRKWGVLIANMNDVSCRMEICSIS